MICYKDKTFCTTEGCKTECSRKLTQDVIDAAAKWFGSDNAPIAMSDFKCGSFTQDSKDGQ